MALWICIPCKTAYSVGAPKCPQCGSKKYAEQGSKNDPTLTDAVPDTAAVETGAEATE